MVLRLQLRVVYQEERVLDRRYHAGCVLVESRAPHVINTTSRRSTFVCFINLSFGQINR